MEDTPSPAPGAKRGSELDSPLGDRKRLRSEIGSAKDDSTAAENFAELSAVEGTALDFG